MPYIAFKMNSALNKHCNSKNQWTAIHYNIFPISQLRQPNFPISRYGDSQFIPDIVVPRQLRFIRVPVTELAWSYKGDGSSVQLA